MIYSRYHAQWAAKLAAERARIQREDAEILGDGQRSEAIIAPAQITTSSPVHTEQNQRRNDNQRRR